MFEKKTFRPNSFKKTDFRPKLFNKSPLNFNKTIGNKDNISIRPKIDKSNKERFVEKKRRTSIVDSNEDYRGFRKEEFDADYQQSNYTTGLPEGEFHMDSFLDFQLS
jgi:hypothetical protein